MKIDRRELITLRISLARVAQAAGICPATFGPLTIESDDGYWALRRKALACDRGWNRLALELVDRLRNTTEASPTQPLGSERRTARGTFYGDDEVEKS